MRTQDLELLHQATLDSKAPPLFLDKITSFGIEQLLDARELETSAKAYQELLRTSKTLPYSYFFRVRLAEGLPVSVGYEGLSGFHIQGHLYALNVGLGKCELVRVEIMPDGKGQDVEFTDIRGQKEIVTDDHGVVTLHRKRSSNTLKELLDEIARFAADVEGSVGVTLG